MNESMLDEKINECIVLPANLVSWSNEGKIFLPEKS
jgi:hypothetical protein